MKATDRELECETCYESYIGHYNSRVCSEECKIPTRRSANYRYRRTRKGYVVRTYRNMLSRVMGIQKKGIKSYFGLNIMFKENFYEWALNDPKYNTLFDEWVASGHDRNLSPSIDRIVGLIGYVEGNMRFITKRENDLDGLESARIMRKIKKQTL